MSDHDFPSMGDALPAAYPSETLRSVLRRRRSASAKLLAEPGPTPTVLDGILATAMRVPDHRKLAPFRFIVFEGEDRTAFGDRLLDAAKARAGTDPVDMGEDTIRTLFARAPVMVAVIASPNVSHKTPVWEQTLTAGAVCYNLLLAASAEGFAGQWLTEWPAYDAHVAEALGLKPHEKVAGFLHLGTAEEPVPERDRPAFADKVSRWR